MRITQNYLLEENVNVTQRTNLTKGKLNQEQLTDSASPLKYLILPMSILAQLSRLCNPVEIIKLRLGNIFRQLVISFLLISEFSGLLYF